MKTLKVTIISLILLLPLTSFATVDYLLANKITKEYYWADEDHSPGWIGWKVVPEVQLDTAVDDLKKLGYTQTFYPYKIETYITILVSTLAAGLYIIKRIVRN